MRVNWRLKEWCILECTAHATAQGLRFCYRLPLDGARMVRILDCKNYGLLGMPILGTALRARAGWNWNRYMD